MEQITEAPEVIVNAFAMVIDHFPMLSLVNGILSQLQNL